MNRIDQTRRLAGAGAGGNLRNGAERAGRTSESFRETLLRADRGNGGTTDLDEIFREASQSSGVPEALLKAVAKAESNFDPDAVSSAGARGIMQLMPGTARALGVTDPMDPRQNIMGGATYLSQKLRQYDGDIELALAAYNAGSGNVAKYGGVPPFKETIRYIEKVLGYMGGDLTAGAVSKSREGNAAGWSEGTVPVGAGVADQLDFRDLAGLFLQSVGHAGELGKIPDSDSEDLSFSADWDIM